MSKPSESICYLCGNTIERDAKDKGMKLSMEEAFASIRDEPFFHSPG